MSSPKDKPAFSIDSLLVALGGMGRYQIMQAILVCISNITICFHLFSFPFVAQTIKHRCWDTTEYSANFSALYSNISDDTPYKQCTITSQNNATNETSTATCQSWAYTGRKEDSIVSEWDLVCGEVFLARLPQSLFIVGQGIGAVTFSALSDKFGRKTLLVIAHFLTACAGIGLGFAPNIAAFSVLRLINGICQQGVVVTSVTLLLETFPTPRRVQVACMYYVIWSVCTVLLTLTGYLVRELVWRWQQLVFTTMSVSIILQIVWLGESIRWLITNKKNKRAMGIVKAATKMNGIDISTIPFKYVDPKVPDEMVDTKKSKYYEDTDTGITVEIEAAQYKYIDLFRSKFLLKINGVIWFSWLVDSLTYFSLYLTASSLADDFYLNFFLNSLAELPSGPLYWFVGRRWGRRRYFMVFHIVAGIGLLSATGVRGISASQAAGTAATVLAFIGKIGNSACFNGMFVYAPEIYPTNLRTAGIGAGSTSARVGGCIAPFITMLAEVVPWAPGTIFGILCLVTSVLNRIFPEPQGHEMPQTIEDIKAWRKSESKESS